jgi:hypothetical protein
MPRKSPVPTPRGPKRRSRKPKPPPPPSRVTLLYRVVPHNGGLVFAPDYVALYVADLHRALDKARTWGEFRSMMPRAEYSRVMRSCFDEEGERRPKSTDPFSAEEVAGWSDGDYPEWVQQDMDLYRPKRS